MKPLSGLFLKSLFAFVFCGAVLCGSFFNGVFLKIAEATDGSGINAVNPTTASVSSSGNIFTFTYNAAENMDSGGIRISVPAGGWSAPQALIGVPGYTTVSSVGIVANVESNLDSSAGWGVTNHMNLSVDTGDKQEGTASLSNAITATATAGEKWYFNYGVASNWGASADGNLRVGMWLKSSVATAAGNINWQDDNSANLASPSDNISLGALSANTWTYTSATLGAASRNSILSYGFLYNTDIGAATIKADSLSVIFSANDSNTGWNGDAGITDSLITGAGNFMEGTGSVRCSYNNSAGVGSSGDCRNSEGSVITVGPGTTVSFWVRPSIALNAGDFAWADDNSATLDSPDSIVNLPALAANTWTYLKITSATSGDMRSFGLRQLVDKGAMTIDIDAIGKQIDTADSTTGWVASASTTQTVSTDVSVLHEGTGSLKNIITASAASGDKWYRTLNSPEDWSSYTTIGLWIRSSVATAAGNLKFEYASSPDLTSPIASVNIGALSANVWSYQKLTLAGTRTNINSYGIHYSTDIGAATVYLDDILLGPGSLSFSGNDINARILSLSAAQAVTIVYGNGGGSSGVTVPATAAAYAFNTSSRISDSGTLTAIGTSPTVTVTLPATSTSIISSGSPSVYGDTVTFTATVTPTGGGAPTGIVTFKDGLTTIGTGALNGASPGIATLNISTLTVADSPHSITATYGGDSGHASSVSNAIGHNVTTKALIVSGISASDKVYDRLTTATLNVSGASLVGVIAPDVVTLNTSLAAGTFSDENVGTGKLVTISGLTLGGVDASKYTLTQPSTTASITAKNLTITGITANDKVYDGNQTAVLVGTPGTLVGVIAPDVVSIAGTAIGTFADANVGTGKLVTISGLSISGTDSANYSLTAPTTTASITAAALTVTGITASDKIYDGNTTAILNTGSATLVGVAFGDIVTLNTSLAAGTFSDENVGTGKLVTISGLTLGGVDASKYTLTQPSTTASITAKNLTITGITANDKVYDGNQTAVLVGTPGTLVGVIAPDVVSIAGTAIGTFADANVGTGKLVTISGLSISGTDSANYSLTAPTTTASITAVNPLTVSGISASDKVYDRLTTATLNVSGASLVGVIAPDVVTLNTSLAAGTFSDKNVGIGKTVTISGLTLSGTDAAKYTLVAPSTTASITTKALTASGITADNKVFDGNTTATLNTGSASLVGIISPDVVTLDTASATGTFADSAIGTGKTVTITGLTIGGVDSGNYSLTQPTATADITSSTVPVVATRLVIVQPSNAVVGTVIPVTIRAEDNSGNLDTSFNNVITLFLTGAATGAGPVTIVNGIGSASINDSVAETVTLALIDAVGLGLDISSTKNVTWTSVVIPPVSSSAQTLPPTPNLRGRAFPGADVQISAFSANAAPVNSRVVSANDGYFDLLLGSGTSVSSFAISATDSNGDKSQTKVFSFDPRIGGQETNLNIIVPPTAKLLRSVITKGDNMVMTGFGFSNSTIHLFIDGVSAGSSVQTDSSGGYRILFNTANLSLGNHEVMVNEVLQNGIVSDYSLRRTLTLSSLFTPKTDFNKDNRVNIQDWSIFLSKWNIPGGPSIDLDLNGDGSVDIADFSIMLRAVQQ